MALSAQLIPKVGEEVAEREGLARDPQLNGSKAEARTQESGSSSEAAPQLCCEHELGANSASSACTSLHMKTIFLSCLLLSKK